MKTGLTAGTSPVDLHLKSWQFIGSVFNSPGVELDLQYNNSNNIGVNMGDLRFDVHSVYNNSQTVHLLNIDFPEFHYSPGMHNLTIMNNFMLQTTNSVAATWQLMTDFIKNTTSLIILKDFHASYVDTGPVTWVNQILGSLGFTISLTRKEPLGQLIWNSAKAKTSEIQTEITDQIPSFPNFGASAEAATSTSPTAVSSEASETPSVIPLPAIASNSSVIGNATDGAMTNATQAVITSSLNANFENASTTLS
jgi:hypothetical protein